MAFPLTRRRFLRSAVSASIAFSGLSAIGGCGNSSSGPDPLAGFDGFGELVPDPDGIMDLPALQYASGTWMTTSPMPLHPSCTR